MDNGNVLVFLCFVLCCSTAGTILMLTVVDPKFQAADSPEQLEVFRRIIMATGFILAPLFIVWMAFEFIQWVFQDVVEFFNSKFSNNKS